MKKIAIITITNSGMNVGNRLQNYALQKVLENYSLRVHTIYSSKNVHNNILLSKIRRILKIIIKTSSRRRIYDAFDRKYITKSKKFRYEGINDGIFNKYYDAFIAGSDQVWNPNFHFNTDFEFMTFAPLAKRYSYSASFGVNSIDTALTTRYAEMLSGIPYISVREKQGQKIVKELCGRDVDVHIDPVMLLNVDHYVSMEEKPPLDLPDRYLLMVFYGIKDDEYTAQIKKIANRLDICVVELSDIPGTPLYNTGPQHFLYILNRAEYICTDSFHTAAFSILYHKQFTVFYRREKDIYINSRIDTLLEKFNLQSRLYNELRIDESMGGIDYTEADRLLSFERDKANEYLTNAVHNIIN